MPETEQQETPQEKPPEKPERGDGAAQRKALDLSDLKEMNIQALTAMARELGVEGAAGMKKHDLIFKILQSQTEKSGLLFAEGVLETPARRLRLPARAGVELPARAPTTSTSRPRRSASSTCAPATPCRGQVRPPKEGERYFALIKVEAINFEPPGAWPRTRSSSTT